MLLVFELKITEEKKQNELPLLPPSSIYLTDTIGEEMDQSDLVFVDIAA